MNPENANTTHPINWTVIAVISLLVLGAVGFSYTQRIKLSPPGKSESAVADTYVENTLRCNQLYEIKKEKYWGKNIGQSKVLYSKALNTCLTYNLYSYPIDYTATETYFGMIIDMGNDKTLLYYTNEKGGGFDNGEKITCERSFDFLEYTKNGEEVKESGCDKFDLFNKMFTIIRGYGFEVFSAG